MTKGYTLRSTTKTDWEYRSNAIQQPRFQYGTVESGSRESSESIANNSSSLLSVLTSQIVEDRSARMTTLSAPVASKQDHAHTEHGNSAVGLYLVMGEGVVLILWLVLFTSIVCYSQYRYTNCPTLLYALYIKKQILFNII